MVATQHVAIHPTSWTTSGYLEKIFHRS